MPYTLLVHAFTAEFKERMRKQGISSLSGEELTRLKLQCDTLLNAYANFLKRVY